MPASHLRHEAPTSWNNKRGRIDIKIDEGTGTTTVVEIKATNWDGLLPHRIRPTALRYASQVWRYINDQVETMGNAVFAGLVYEHEPRRTEVRLNVENVLNERFIQVVWRKGPIKLRKRP